MVTEYIDRETIIEKKKETVVEKRHHLHPPQPLHNLDQIRRHPHGRDLAAGARALHDERVRAVPLGVEADDVVAALEARDGAVPVELL